MISDYFNEVERGIAETKIIVEREIDYKEFSGDEGMIRGELLFINGYVLKFMEYISKEERPKYRFHLMDKGGKMIFRYDNAPHYKVPTFPHHKHFPGGVKESKEKGIVEVIKEIKILVLKI